MPSLGEDAALAVIDMQEDFCPPNGALAVKDGRDITPIINGLLSLPFKTKFATQDYHPADHCSFASQHAGAKPFTSSHTIWNPEASGTDAEEQTTVLWPDHCVQGTAGCEFIPELEISRIEHFIKKGEDRRVEAYSAFGPPFRKPAVGMSRLPNLLRDSKIKRVFVCGLAFDYCVKCTAIDAADAGYETYLVEDASKAVDQNEEALAANKRQMQEHGVRFIRSDAAVLKT
ncbi:hypothetical protein Q7P37_004504 [Cladosporium fusiforme]